MRAEPYFFILSICKALFQVLAHYICHGQALAIRKNQIRWSQTSTETETIQSPIIESPVKPSCMFLDSGRKPVYQTTAFSDHEASTCLTSSPSVYCVAPFSIITHFNKLCPNYSSNTIIYNFADRVAGNNTTDKMSRCRSVVFPLKREVKKKKTSAIFSCHFTTKW